MNDYFINVNIQMAGIFLEPTYKNRIGEFKYYSEEGMQTNLVNICKRQ